MVHTTRRQYGLQGTKGDYNKRSELLKINHKENPFLVPLFKSIKRSRLLQRKKEGCGGGTDERYEKTRIKLTLDRYKPKEP